MNEPNPMVLTERAAAKVRELRDDEGNPHLKLRVYITGGGCAGFSYGFTFDEQVNDDDTSVDREDVTLLVDAMSIQYLDGSEVDYEQGLMGARSSSFATPTPPRPAVADLRSRSRGHRRWPGGPGNHITVIKMSDYRRQRHGCSGA